MNERLVVAPLSKVKINPGEYGVVVHIDRDKKHLNPTTGHEEVGSFASAGIVYGETVVDENDDVIGEQTQVALTPHLIRLPGEANGKLSSQFLGDVIQAQAAEVAGVLAIPYRDCINDEQAPDAEIQQAAPIISMLAQALKFEEAQKISNPEEKQLQVDRILALLTTLFPTIGETMCGYHNRGDAGSEETQQWADYFSTQGRRELEATGGLQGTRILKLPEQSNTILIASHFVNGLPVPQAIAPQATQIIEPSVKENHLLSGAYVQNVSQPAKEQQRSTDYYLQRLFRILDMPLGLEALHEISGVGKKNQFTFPQLKPLQTMSVDTSTKLK